MVPSGRDRGAAGQAALTEHPGLVGQAFYWASGLVGLAGFAYIEAFA